MSWSYRILKYADNDGYGLHEVYFDANNQVTGWTERAITVSDTPKGIVDQLLQMRLCAKHRPVLDETLLTSQEAKDGN
jgi:hypothetical protein